MSTINRFWAPKKRAFLTSWKYINFEEMFSTRKKNACTLIEFYLSAPIEYTTNLTQKLCWLLAWILHRAETNHVFSLRFEFLKLTYFLDSLKEFSNFPELSSLRTESRQFRKFNCDFVADCSWVTRLLRFCLFPLNLILPHTSYHPLWRHHAYSYRLTSFRWVVGTLASYFGGSHFDSNSGSLSPSRKTVM